MEYLYVCLFSNKQIKVGRSIEPKARVAAHADRVSCVGIDLIDHEVFECAGPAEPREAALIARCVAAAPRRYKSEWFEGLAYEVACEWARIAAVSEVIEAYPATMWSNLIAQLRAAGYTQARLATECGCSATTMSCLATGKLVDPVYSLGVLLVSLHQRVCEQPL